MGDLIQHPEQLGGTLCTAAPLYKRGPMGTEHLSALGDGTQAEMGSNPEDQPPSHPSRAREGTEKAGGEGKNKYKKPPPPRAPRHRFGHCKLDFLKRKCFTGHKLSQKKWEGGRKLCNFFFFCGWKNKGDVAGVARWELVGTSSCHRPVAQRAPNQLPPLFTGSRAGFARYPRAVLSSASSAAFCLYFWVQFSLEEKKRRRKGGLACQLGSSIHPKPHSWDADPASCPGC